MSIRLLKIIIDRETGREAAREEIGSGDGEINHSPLCNLILDKMAEEGLLSSHRTTASGKAG